MLNYSIAKNESSHKLIFKKSLKKQKGKMKFNLSSKYKPHEKASTMV